MPRKLPAIPTWEERILAETAEGETLKYRQFMQKEIDELRKRVAILTGMVRWDRAPCEDPECGDGYGCICYTR